AHVTRAVGDSLPVRHAGHAYDSLVFAGATPADVYVVDVRESARDIDVDAMLEALHRASPQATFVALADENASLPAFVTRVDRGDTAALRALAVPAESAAPPAAVP